MMKRVVVFIDGFNVYHAINDNPDWHIYKWLNLSKLSQILVPKTERVEAILYFTALATWMPDKMARHRIYIKALELHGVQIIYGLFEVRDKHCPNCNTWYQSHEEKQTDVNIATQLYKLAVEDRYDKALIMSGDSDLIPAVKSVKSTFPTKDIVVAVPIGRRAEELKLECDSHMRIRLKHLRDSRFPEEIDIGDGQFLSCPAPYRMPQPLIPPT